MADCSASRNTRQGPLLLSTPYTLSHVTAGVQTLFLYRPKVKVKGQMADGISKGFAFPLWDRPSHNHRFACPVPCPQDNRRGH